MNRWGSSVLMGFLAAMAIAAWQLAIPGDAEAQGKAQGKGPGAEQDSQPRRSVFDPIPSGKVRDAKKDKGDPEDGEAAGKAQGKGKAQGQAQGQGQGQAQGQRKGAPEDGEARGKSGERRPDQAGKPGEAGEPGGEARGRDKEPGPAEAASKVSNVAKEQRKHLKNQARIDRLATLGKEGGNQQLIEKAEMLRGKEMRRHQKAMDRLDAGNPE